MTTAIAKTFEKAETIIKKWNRLPFNSGLIQLIISIGYLAIMVGLITVRDGFYIYINKYIFVFISFLFLIFLKKEYIICTFAFILPFSHAIPMNWVMLIFFSFLFIKNRFRINIAQIIFPLTFGIIELFLVIKAKGFSDGDYFFKCFQYFSFLLFSCYLLLDRYLIINKKRLVYFFAVGVSTMATITLLLQLKMINKLVIFDPQYNLIDLAFNPYIRLESLSVFNEWITMMAKGNVIIIFPEADLVIGDDPNNMAFYLIISTAFLLYITTNKKKSYIINLFLLLFIGALGLYTKSRSFLITFPFILIVWYVISLISKRYSIKSLWILSIILITCFIILLILNNFVNIFEAIFGRFSNIGTSDKETGRFALIISYLQSIFSNWFTALFGAGVICSPDVLNQQLLSHTAIIQIIGAYGIFGTIIFGILSSYIIYVRVSFRKKLIDLNSFIPIFAAFIFTLALQILSPFFIMIVCSLTVLPINNFSTIKAKRKNLSLLTNIWNLNNPSGELIIEYSGDDNNNYPLYDWNKDRIIRKAERKQIRALKKEERKTIKSEKILIQNYICSSKNADSIYSIFDNYLCDEVITKEEVENKKWFNKLNNFIDKVYEKISLNKLIQLIKSSAGQLIVIIVYATLIELYACIVSFLYITDAKIYLVILLAFVTLFMNKKTIILCFAFMISMSNFLPQRYLILFFFFTYFLKNRFKINIAQISFCFIFILFELLDCFMFGFANSKETFSFLLIVSFLIYVCLDKTLKIQIEIITVSYMIGFVFASIMLIYPFMYYSFYAIDNATIVTDKNIFDIIVNNKFRLGDYRTLFWYLNDTFGASLTLNMIPTLSDNPNNIAYFAFFATVLCFFLFKNNIKKNILISFLIILSISVGLLTKSKTFVIATIICIALFYIFAFVQRKISLKVGIIIAFAIAFGFIVFWICDPTFSSISYYFGRPDIEGDNGSYRIELINKYLNFMFTNVEYLFTGTGLINISTLSNISALPHTNIIQVFVAYGIIGTILILIGFAFVINVRLCNHKLDFYYLIPILGVTIFTLTTQALNPYELMYPFLISIIFINNGNYMQEKETKSKYLFYIWPFNRKK